MTKSKTPERAPAGPFTVGRKAMVKLNAVEGITLGRASTGMFREFDRKGASAEERRREIVAKHAKKG